MKLGQKIPILDRLAGLVGHVLKARLQDHVHLTSADDNRTLVMDDGSLLSLVRFGGSLVLLGQDDLTALAERLRLSLSPYFTKPGHALQFFFARDPTAAAARVQQMQGRARRVATAAGLAIDDLLDERQRNLSRLLVDEASYIAVFTRVGVLSKAEVRAGKEKTAAEIKGAPRLAQWPEIALDPLRSRHASLTDAIVHDLAASGLHASLMEVHAAVAVLRGLLYPSRAEDPAWRCLLPGDAARPRMPETDAQLKGADDANCAWPTLSDQLVTEDAEILDGTTVRLGDTVISGFDMTVAPEVLQPFSELLRRVDDNAEPISWRVCFLIEAGGIQAMALKEQFVRIFAFASPTNNKRIRDAIDRLRALHGTEDTVIRLRVSFAAWSSVGQEAALKMAVSNLRRAVERWGNAQTDGLSGDPLSGAMSSLPGLHCASTAPAAAAPLQDTLALLPWDRPASPWAEGAVLFRTPDGKAWPYQPGSSLQTTWVDLMVGPPGSGKSVLLNTISLAAALAPQVARDRLGQTLLPRIAVIDVGPSSSGLISLLQEALPPARRHEVVYQRLKMSPSHAINPLDTQLGLRRPLATERAFIVNLLSLVCTPSDMDAPHEGMTHLIGAVVDQAYETLSDKHQPRRYTANDNHEVDRALRELSVEIDHLTTWWEVADSLMEADRPHLAALAQRYAVPLLADLNTAASDQKINDLYGRITVSTTGESLTGAFQRLISSTIKEYPILAHPTRFDLSTARVASLDLDEVAIRSGQGAARQTTLMYMLARHALVRDFFLDETEIRAVDPKPTYLRYHLHRAQTNRQMPKRICYDEFHRTQGLAIRDQVLLDIREGRKHGVQVALASQLLEDFPEQLVQLATSVWICAAPTEPAIADLTKVFGYNSAVEQVLRSSLRGPTERGAPVFATMRLKLGVFHQLLVNSLGPVEIWAFSTTAEDAALRARLYETIGPRKARELLARRFPGGTAKPELERRLARLEDQGRRVDDHMQSTLIDQLAEELLEGARLADSFAKKN